MAQAMIENQNTPVMDKNRKSTKELQASRKKCRKNIMEDPNTLFDDLLQKWKNHNLKFTGIDLSLHGSDVKNKKNFLCFLNTQ